MFRPIVTLKTYAICNGCKYYEHKARICKKFGNINHDGSVRYENVDVARILDCKGDFWEQKEKTSVKKNELI